MIRLFLSSRPLLDISSLSALSTTYSFQITDLLLVFPKTFVSYPPAPGGSHLFPVLHRPPSRSDSALTSLSLFENCTFRRKPVIFFLLSRRFLKRSTRTTQRKATPVPYPRDNKRRLTQARSHCTWRQPHRVSLAPPVILDLENRAETLINKQPKIRCRAKVVLSFVDAARGRTFRSLFSEVCAFWVFIVAHCVYVFI